MFMARITVPLHASIERAYMHCFRIINKLNDIFNTKLLVLVVSLIQVIYTWFNYCNFVSLILVIIK